MTTTAAKPQAPWLSEQALARAAARVMASDDAERMDCPSPLVPGSLGSLPRSTVDDVEAAFVAARAAQTPWAARPVKERVAFLDRLHDIVLAGSEELCDLIQLESGKTRLQAWEEVMDTAGTCRHYARKAPKYLAEQKVLGGIPGLTQTSVHYRPKGVVGIVAPWNYPLSMCITDALPALAAGNAVVLRPDTKTSLTAMAVVRMCDEAGLPPQLLQVVMGRGADVGGAVLDRADYVMFTGSTSTGREVARDAGERLVGASLELGGKNALYVADDADLEAAAECAARAAFSSAGQLCISIERIVLHEAIADAFTAKFVARVKRMKLSNRLEFGADMGSLITQRQLDTVTEHVADAREKGAKVLVGGNPRPDLGPYFYEPTVLSEVTDDMLCRREETFGPLVSLYRVADDEAAVDLMNDSEYGLNAAVWSRDLARGREIAGRVKAGTVNVNEGYAAAWCSYGAPMGGMKASGVGRRHGAEGIRKYTDLQNVATQRALGFAVPRGVTQKQYTAVFGLGLKAMKKVGLS